MLKMKVLIVWIVTIRIKVGGINIVIPPPPMMELPTGRLAPQVGCGVLTGEEKLFLSRMTEFIRDEKFLALRLSPL